MKNIIFCQFSTKFLYRNYKQSLADKYYNSIYIKRARQGYYKGADFWELPLWIAEASFILKRFIKSLYIIKDLDQAINYLNKSRADFILFSVLDINKNYVYKIIKTCKDKNFIIGGYADLTEFNRLKNCIVLKDMPGLAGYFNLNYSYGVNYKLFKGFKIIPRLVLSTGCLNNCKFCTIEKIIIEKSKMEILQQTRAFKDLDFKLVYINDKTLGQASNYKMLGLVYNKIKKYNPKFKGFIIQTTAGQINKKGFTKELKALKVFTAEIGIESFNNKILQDLRKPQNKTTIIKAIENLKRARIKIIGNFIIGLINENKKTYNNTLGLIKKYIKDFYILNIYNLAIYKDTELDQEIKSKDKNKFNELEPIKDFYSKTDIKNINYFTDKIYRLGLRILNN